MLAGVAFPIYLVLHAFRVNGASSFPLDDPWIHLTYARNLALHHSFAYFPGDPTSGGSTSPLYTLLLSLGFLFTRHEKGLSFALGLLFQGGFLAFAFLWARRRLDDWIWAAAFVLLLAFDLRIAILAVSGMETSLFLMLIACAFWARAEGRGKLLGLSLGLALWVRPDALILCGVLVIAGALERWMQPAHARPTTDRSSRARVPAWVLPFALTAVAYFAWNLVTSGSLLPNTLAAKHAFYTTPKLTFVKGDLRECFLAYAFWGLTPLALVGAVVATLRLARRQASPLLGELGWAIGLPLAYLLVLPFSHRFSRYLVPALPAVAMLGLACLKDFAAAFQGRKGPRASFSWSGASGVVGGVGLAALLVVELARVGFTADQYAMICRYHFERHERCGKWLKENTPPDAVIATHDVGAIAYYSERRVIDTVGLIQKDAIPHLHKPDYTSFLADFFTREKVTHVAVLRNWLEVVNVRPVFVADPHPELLEVFPWIPGRTHLVSDQVTAMDQRAAQLLRTNLPASLSLAQRALDIDPENGRTWLLLGAGQELNHDLAAAEHSYREGLARYPEAEEGLFALSYLLYRQGQKDEARMLAAKLESVNPGLPQLAQLKAALAQ